MKRILLLSDISSEHTEKWALSLADKGLEIGLFSLTQSAYPWYEKHTRIQLLSTSNKNTGTQGRFAKLKYLKILPQLKKAIRSFNPDIVHAHYASSYGLLARLSGFKPYFVSAWGTDVMKFPFKNSLFKQILKSNLKQAAVVTATSQTIVEFIHKVIDIPVKVIPFGVDLNQFKPAPKLPLFDPDTIVIAAIKVLDTIYCIDILMDAFAVLVKINPKKKLGLLLVGTGRLENELKQKAKDLKLEDKIIFTGRVNFSDVAHYFNTADIFVNISEYESFGVSVIEASACEKPVVVTDVGGLKEVVDEGVTGQRIKVRNVEETVAAIEKFILYPDLAKKMGTNGRKKVEEFYDWNKNVNQMIEAYKLY